MSTSASLYHRHRFLPKSSVIAFPANYTARVCDETIQVIGPLAAFSLGLRKHYLTLPSGKISIELALTEQ